LVPLGTPLLAGPGAIAATMLYVRQADDLGGALSVVLALVAVLVVVYLSMRCAPLLGRVLRANGIHLLARVVGRLLAALAAQLAGPLQHPAQPTSSTSRSSPATRLPLRSTASPGPSGPSASAASATSATRRPP